MPAHFRKNALLLHLLVKPPEYALKTLFLASYYLSR